MNQKLSDTERATLFLHLLQNQREWNKEEQIKLLSGLTGWTHQRCEKAFLKLEMQGMAKSVDYAGNN